MKPTYEGGRTIIPILIFHSSFTAGQTNQIDPTPMGTTQPANRGRALILGVLHAMAVPTEPKSGTGIVETIRRTVVIADMTFYIIISAKHHYLTRVGAPRIERVFVELVSFAGELIDRGPAGLT